MTPTPQESADPREALAAELERFGNLTLGDLSLKSWDAAVGELVRKNLDTILAALRDSGRKDGEPQFCIGHLWVEGPQEGLGRGQWCQKCGVARTFAARAIAAEGEV